MAEDPQQREAAFTFLLPELIQVEPERVVAMFDRQKPGEARETLRSEMARQWTVRDFHAAVAWMKSLDEHERRASANTAVKSIAPYAPAVAHRLTREFDLRGQRQDSATSSGVARTQPASRRGGVDSRSYEKAKPGDSGKRAGDALVRRRLGAASSPKN